MWESRGCGGPERGGQGGESLPSAPQHRPLLLGYLMGQEVGGGGRKPQGCRRSHFLPHPEKEEGPTASSQVGVGAGRAGSQLSLGGWVLPACSAVPHLVLTLHLEGAEGGRSCGHW